MKLVIAYLSLAAALAAFLSYASSLSKYKELSADGIPAIGKITRQDCGNHNTFLYRFEAVGQAYEARGRDGAEKKCESLLVGDPVNIYYLPSNPHVNMSGSPASALRNEVTSIAMAAIFLPAFVVWAYQRRRRNNDA